MIASGEWPDLFNPSDRYTGGAAQAYQDEVIIDLPEMLPVYAPDYRKYVQELGETDYNSLLTTTNDGDDLHMMVSTINDCTYTNRGFVCRADWLDELGYVPADMGTLDGFTKVLTNVYNKYGCGYTLNVDETGTLKNFNAFKSPIPDITSTSNLSVYLDDDGKVLSGWVSDEYRRYIEWFRDLYVAGVINENFMVDDWDQNKSMTMTASGEVFMWETGNDGADDVYEYLRKALH